MTVATKICGLSNQSSIEAAVEGGARWIGFVFYPKSPRSVTRDQAKHLARHIPRHAANRPTNHVDHPCEIVALLVDPDDAVIDDLLGHLPIDLIQLHGRETPDRCAAIRARFQKPVMKAFGIAAPDDLAAVDAYRNAVDYYLFDAKPAPDARPGGNGVSFDWRLLADRSFDRPWMLSGGLTAATLPQAVCMSGARIVDVSSGVEVAPGIKDDAAIRAFLASAHMAG